MEMSPCDKPFTGLLAEKALTDKPRDFQGLPAMISSSISVVKTTYPPQQGSFLYAKDRVSGSFCTDIAQTRESNSDTTTAGGN